MRIEKLAARTVSPRFREALAVRFLARAQKVARLIPRVGDCFAIKFTRRQPIALGPIARAPSAVERLVVRTQEHSVRTALIAFNILLATGRMMAHASLSARPARHNATDLSGLIAVVDAVAGDDFALLAAGHRAGSPQLREIGRLIGAGLFAFVALRCVGLPLLVVLPLAQCVVVGRSERMICGHPLVVLPGRIVGRAILDDFYSRYGFTGVCARAAVTWWRRW